jgi:hypothetical protein
MDKKRKFSASVCVCLCLKPKSLIRELPFLTVMPAHFSATSHFKSAHFSFEKILREVRTLSSVFTRIHFILCIFPRQITLLAKCANMEQSQNLRKIAPSKCALRETTR